MINIYEMSAMTSSDSTLTLELINDCLKVVNKADLKGMYEKLKNKLAIDSMIAGRVCRFSHTQQGHFFGLSREWREAYTRENYLAVDPVYKLAISANKPIRWQDVYKDSDDSGLGELAADLGLKAGFSYASKAYAMPSVTTSVSLGQVCESFSPAQEQIICHVVPHITEVLAKPSLWPRPSLTFKEVEVLKWCAQGKSYWETSLLMSVSERTVKFHMNNVFKKLNVGNKAQAVARFVSLAYA